MVNRLALTVELATQHLCGDGHLEHIAGELAVGVRVVNVSCAFEDLSNKLELSLSSKTREEGTRAIQTRPPKTFLQAKRRLCFTYLDDGLSACDFEDLTLSSLAIAQLHVDDLCISGCHKQWLVRWEAKGRASEQTYLGNLTLSRITRGPSTSSTVR